MRIASLPGTSSTGASARFSSSGAPWVRRDGIQIVSNAAALFEPSGGWIDAPIDVSASGVYLDDQTPDGFVWSTPLRSGASSTCNDWTTSSYSASGMTAILGSTWGQYAFGLRPEPCGVAGHLYCLQQ